MLKKISSIFIFLISLINLAYAMDIPSDYKTLSGEKLFNEINEEIKDIYEVTDNFYPNINYNKKSVNYKLIENNIKDFGCLQNEVMYGTPYSQNVDCGVWDNVYFSYIGQDKYGEGKVDRITNKNQFVLFSKGWSGYRYNGKFWDDSVSRDIIPYSNIDLRNWWREHNKEEIYRNNYTQRNDITFTQNGTLEESIQKGVDEVWANVGANEVDKRPSKGKPTSHNGNGVVHKYGETPPGGWNNMLLVEVPPTYISWGMGERYNYDPKNGNYYNLTIPIAPFAMIDKELYISETNCPSSCTVGKDIKAIIYAKTKSIDSVNTDYKWTVTGANGVVYSGNGNAMNEQGSVQILPKQERNFISNFKMPDNDVTVRFEINPSKNPIENNYSNNVFETTIKVVRKTDEIAVNAPDALLDYDILTRRFKYPLSNGVPKSTDLGNPPNGGTWSGNASVMYNSGNLFFVNANMPLKWASAIDKSVDTKGTVAELKTNVIATIERQDYGDDPTNKQWHNGESPISRDAIVEYEGSAVREYTNSLGKGTVFGDFAPGSDRLNVIVKTYNGMQNLPIKPNVQTDSTGSGNNNGVIWEGDNIALDVIRYMHRMDENGNRYDDLQFDGQFQRTFVGQSTASINWKNESPKNKSSLEYEYAKDRENASDRLTGIGNYNKAVFATDKQLQSFAYPIKSGYHFNPAGAYTCEVVTTQYKATNEDTAEHKELVSKIINSFHYQSALQYINNREDIYTINLTNDTKSESDCLSISSNIKNPDKTVLDSTTNINGDIDPLIKECLEGYAESGTENSAIELKYKEYVKWQKIYKITERTIITFKVEPINPKNRKLYTSLKMKNGEYPITVSADSFSFAGQTVKGVQNLDHISVTVRGSMYDDID